MANAQNQSAPSTTVPGTPNSSANIPDNKLDAAAAAIRNVATVRKDYEQRIDKAPDDAEKSRIAEEGNQALNKAITEHGLSVAEYRSILQVAQNNKAVHDKILQRLK
jgi:hypothetical protein